MNAVRLLLLTFATGLLSSTTLAQTPSKPPPWWGVHDEVTVSLYWSFDGPAPFTPTQIAVPTWYSPSVTVMAPTANIVPMPTLNTHVGVVGILGNTVPQAGAIDLQVDNDPHLNWVKIFWFQFDAFKGAGGDVEREIEQDLTKYGRAIVSETSEPIGNGWERVTVQAQLIPQPDDEGIDWSFVSTGGSVAIDNLYVSSKCVKPGPDESGDALGQVGQVIPLTGFGGTARGAAVTQGPAPTFAKSFWVAQASSAIGVQHNLVQLQGTVITTTPLGATAATVPQGPGDLAVETRTNSAGVVIQQIVWTILDARQATGQARLVGVDAATGVTSILPLQFPPVTTVPSLQTLGLAFDPSGELGGGTFWVASTDAGGIGAMREFSRDPSHPGLLLDTQPLPAGCAGLGYDDTLGSFWGFSNTPEQSPNGPVQVNGFEVSGFDFARTGVRFCGDLLLQNGAGPRGGLANGFDVYRDRGALRSQLNMVCVVDTPGNPLAPQFLYELAGPFGFGYSQFGRCGMRNVGAFGGVPFLGGAMEVSLTGVPDALFAMMFLGFSNTTYLGSPLPLSLAFAGMPESFVSVSPDVSTALMPPAAPGEFRMPIPIPPGLAPYTPVFFQWVVLHPNVPGFLAATQAGKTVLYP